MSIAVDPVGAAVPAATPSVAPATAAVDVEQIQASTRQLLLALLELDGAELGAPSLSGLGTRRHVVARLVRHADRARAVIEGDREPIADDALLRAAHPQIVDRVATSLGAVIAALTVASDRPLDAVAEVAADHLAWLELSHVDLGVGRAVSAIPDSALDAVASHFQGSPSSPFAALVAA